MPVERSPVQKPEKKVSPLPILRASRLDVAHRVRTRATSSRSSSIPPDLDAVPRHPPKDKPAPRRSSVATLPKGDLFKKRISALRPPPPQKKRNSECWIAGLDDSLSAAVCPPSLNTISESVNDEINHPFIDPSPSTSALPSTPALPRSPIFSKTPGLSATLDWDNSNGTNTSLSFLSRNRFRDSPRFSDPGNDRRQLIGASPSPLLDVFQLSNSSDQQQFDLESSDLFRQPPYSVHQSQFTFDSPPAERYEDLTASPRRRQPVQPNPNQLVLGIRAFSTPSDHTPPPVMDHQSSSAAPADKCVTSSPRLHFRLAFHPCPARRESKNDHKSKTSDEIYL